MTDLSQKVRMYKGIRMRLYIKNKVFSRGGKIDVFDENGVSLFYTEREKSAFGAKLRIFYSSGVECLQIKERAMAFMPEYRISMDDKVVATVKRKFSITRSKYFVKESGWIIEGDFTKHNFTVSDGGNIVARVCERRLSWGDTFEIDVTNDDEKQLVLAIVVIINAATKKREISASEI